MLLALPWFLCFFVGYLPWEVVLRTLDSFFAEGPNILLQVGMAVMITHKDEIMKRREITSVLDFLRDDAKFDCKSFCEVCNPNAYAHTF